MARIPDEYRQYMSKMNDMVEGGFTFKNCPSSWSNQWGDRFYIRSYPAENYSFFTTNRNGGNNITIFSFKNNNGMSPINLQASDKLTLNITGSGNSYIGTVEHITDINIAYKGSTNYQYIDLKVNSDWSCTIYSGSSYGNISTPTNNVTLTQTGTLADVLDYFSARLRNVEVYVNGVPWDDIATYNWQSVPSISGKNGILLLSTIQSVYLNNGDPVNNALESYIDFIDDSKVAVLVEQEIDDLTKVTVKYVVPAGTYEYIKLVYKTGSAPTSVTDGTAVDILQAAKKVILSGIADGSTYFFKIFTDITESEPYEFTTVRPAGENFFLIDFNSDGRDTMRYNASKTIHVQADSMYSMRDIDYYAAQGALADPVSPSNPTYTISNGEVTTANNSHYLCWAYDVTANQRIIPANCTLWFEFDAYFLNSEGYLDWRMYNNQAVEVIYWCWDTRYAFSANQWYNCKLEATITNGFITTIKYYVDNNMVEQDTRNIHMLCIDEDNPVSLYFITFQTTKPTKLKNMKIYWE